MLLDNIINIKISNRTKKHFINKGYIGENGYFKVNSEDMNNTNRTRVRCECDYCGKINTISWDNYCNQIKKENIYSCHKCHYNKSKIIFLKKYGVENPAKLEIVKDKMKNTCLEKYGHKFALCDDGVKNKIKKTILEKYGVENIFQSDEIKEKIKKTNLEKFGAENVFSNESSIRLEINQKVKESFIKNKSEININKIKTCLKKYGVEYHTQSQEVKDKTKITNLNKYNFEYVLQSEDIKEKSRKTCLEKYGVNHYTKTNEYSNRAKNTRINLGIQISDELRTEFELYRKKVDNLTKKLKKELINNWNGFDYYDKEYIKDNFKYKFYSKLYPTIDHKISVYYGFMNNISPENISDINNLCITKRKINSSKQSKNEDCYLF